MSIALDPLYIVPLIYTSVVATNPNSLLGVGSWAVMGQGRVLMGAGGSYGAGSQGGTATETLSLAQIPSHTHYSGWRTGSGTGSAGQYATLHEGPASINTGAAGSGSAHNNLQPYLVVYMWKRTS